MRIKKFLRFFMLFLFIIIASILPFPIHFYRNDNHQTYEIEQIEKKEDEEDEGEEYQAFS